MEPQKKYVYMFQEGSREMIDLLGGKGAHLSEVIELPRASLTASKLSKNPFETIDEEGVGELIAIGVERGRKTRPDLEIGICGEHGGDPESIAFCHKVGMNYVSCAPYRIPIARLAAAHAALKDKEAK